MSLALAPLDVSVELEANLPCRKFDPDLWFSDSPTELELAKSLCGDCPLRVECLAGAVERAEPWGVWGGEIFERGAVVPRKRPRGRPRKEDVARDAALRVEAEARLAASGLASRVARSGWRPDMFPIRTTYRRCHTGTRVEPKPMLHLPNGATEMQLLHEALSRARMRRPQAGRTTTSTEATRSARTVAMPAAARRLANWASSSTDPQPRGGCRPGTAARPPRVVRPG